MWGKDLEVMLLDVPNFEGVKYLPKAQVDHLQLGILGYPEQVLLIRKEYIFSMNDLTSKSLCKGRGVVVTGQPGIWYGPISANGHDHLAHISVKYDEGKSCFLFYVLLHRLCGRQPTALQRGQNFVIFDETGVHVHDNDDKEGPVINKGTWALTDSQPTSIEPCGAFYWSSIDRKAWIVGITPDGTMV